MPAIDQTARTARAATPVSQLSPAEARQRLIAVITERSFGTGVEIKLASGRTSNFYFNMKPTMLHPQGSALIGRLLCDLLAAEPVDMVGGLEMGAVPVATAVAAMSAATARPLPAFFVRKAAKEHGTQALIEGLPKGETLAGRRVAIVEDVTTTGGSAMKAVDIARAAGAEVVLVATIVDRQEGAEDGFAAAGLKFVPLLRRSDFSA